MKPLSYDYDPRELVANKTLDSFSTSGETRLSAVYIPTAKRPGHIATLLSKLDGLDVPIYLLPTDTEDLPKVPTSRNIDVLPQHGYAKEFHHLMSSLRCLSNPLFAIPSVEWDLPLKRNYALWHASKNNLRNVMLLDDDVRQLDATRVSLAASALDQYHLAGFFVDSFPDTSVVGHMELAIGEPVSTFMSGSCLFLNATSPLGFFPPVYNEDWIFMAPHIASGHVVSLGLVAQEQYDPFMSHSLAAFQEPGEIIADGLFSLIASDRYHERYDSSVWITLLTMRHEWLLYLKQSVSNAKHLAAIESALAKSQTVTPIACAEYINDWEYDRDHWNKALV